MSGLQHRRAARSSRRAVTLRRQLEAAAERLADLLTATVAELDALDGDADLEPSTGAPEDHNRRARRVWAEGGDTDEREEASEDEGGACEDEGADTGDAEPWLAAKEGAQGYYDAPAPGREDLEANEPEWAV